MYQDHFALEAIVTVNGNTLQFKNKPLFVFDKVTRVSYLISSVQDDDLLRWMLSHNNRLTILKHCRQFSAQLHPEDFAQRLLISVEGANAICRVLGSSKPMQNILKAFKTELDSYTN